MPEIAEVQRIVHFIRQHLVGKRISRVEAQHDENVFGKVGTSSTAFEQAMHGKRIVSAGSQGKYFWMEMDSPPHPVLHFGMTGWMHIRDQATYYYDKPRDGADEQWPPRFWKFQIETQPEKNKPVAAAAFTDSRRFGRVRLVDCEGHAIRQTTPLKENGPDPVVDTDRFTEDFLHELCARKKIPIKALMLDQANISGIGNWVGDEVLYHARIHPEQYAHTLKTAQVTQLYKSIRYICTTACDALADSDKFPEAWLFKHRWGKGKKDSPNVLPNGAKIVFVTVGGRTSAVVPSVQRKTGPVAADVDDGESKSESIGDGGVKQKGETQGKKSKKATSAEKVKAEAEESKAAPKKRKRDAKSSAETNGSSDKPADVSATHKQTEQPPRSKRGRANSSVKTDGTIKADTSAVVNDKSKAKRSTTKPPAKPSTAAKRNNTTVPVGAAPAQAAGRRRSGRLSSA